jgi:hypothetical protein
MATKECRSCNELLTENNYKSFYNSRCLDCYNSVKRAERKRRYDTDPDFKEKERNRARARTKNPDIIAAYLNNPCKDCKDHLTLENHKNYHGPRCGDCYRKLKRDRKRVKYQTDSNFKSALQERNKTYHKDNRSKVNIRRKKRYNDNPIFRLRLNLSNRINDALKSNSKTSSTEALIGMSFYQFKNWIEFQFEPEMTWENHGTYWEIDHVRPCASFVLTDESQQKACFHWSNQRPTSVRENRIKEDKLLPDLISEHEKKVAIYRAAYIQKLI